jgi:hypothetical protein
MKFLIIGLLMLSSAFADENQDQKINEAKQRISGHIDQRISALQSHKSCIQSASSKDQLKSCKQSHKEEMKRLKSEHQSQRDAKKQGKKEEKNKS